MRVIETDRLIQQGGDWFYQDRRLSDTEKNWIYNGLDCMVTHEVHSVLDSQFDSTTRATYEFEKALMGPILEMNMRGVLIDEYYRRKLVVEYQNDLDRVTNNLNLILNDGLGVNLNWRSNPGLLHLFYDILGLPPVKKRNVRGEFTPTVNRDALEKLSEYFYAQPIINHILSLRDLGKKISFLKTGIDEDGRIRTSFNIGGTTTGRLSSNFSDFGTGTNLQNIEARLRRVFIADRGYKFANIDLEQSDSRGVGAIIWNLFADGKYLDACESDQPGGLHTQVSNMVWPGIDPQDLFYRNNSYRQSSKKLGHATNFYGQPPEISKQVKIPLPLVKEFQSLYLNQFPGIPRWWEQRRQVLLDEGKLTSLLGMRRSFFGRRNDNQTFKKMIAFEPQNITAWTINKGLLRTWWDFGKIVHLLLQVHDSILLQFPEELEDEIIPMVKDCIDGARAIIQLRHNRSFVIPAEVQTGWNWAYQVTEEDQSRAREKGEEVLPLNPDGLKKFMGHDSRSRSVQPPVTSKLDYRILRLHGQLPIAANLSEVDGDLNDSS